MNIRVARKVVRSWRSGHRKATFKRAVRAMERWLSRMQRQLW